ncbi:MAG TPA: Gfo/Idh/MocA family oxidoreductase [Candidatus Atribacteria bacterium]|nr:Gfo/Idh/MocA family oxidoreductase [Candidatus Atribacteria bacterium]
MIKIGIVGSDNSHALAFSQVTNLPQGVEGLKVEEAEVVAIWGFERNRTEEVAKLGNIPEIVNYPEDMIGNVDAVMVVLRDGALHYKFSKPFIEAGIPTFIDKPLETSIDNAKRIITLAQEKNTPITSFSTLRYDEPVERFKEDLSLKGPLTTGVVCGPADTTSEYQGIFFYGVHIVELSQEIFGRGVESLMATNHHNNIAITLTYSDERIVELLMLGNATYTFTISAFGKNGWGHWDGSQTPSPYYYGLLKFIDMIKTSKMPLSYDELVEVVAILKAIEVSYLSNTEVRIKDLI